MSQDLQADIANVLSRVELTRRDMVVTSLAAGFALAVQPVSAATITTSSEGLTAGEVKIPVGDSTIPGYRAMPAKGGPVPGRAGRAGDFRRARAHQGCLPSLRQARLSRDRARAVRATGRRVEAEVHRRDPRRSSSKVPDEQVMSDLDAAVEFAKETGKGDVTRLGITGFCWGGRIVWLYAAHSKQLKAGVAWYGRLVGEPSELTPKHPVNIAADLKAPVLGSVRGQGSGHSARERRADAHRAEGGESPVGDRRVSRRAARLPRRLPADVTRKTMRRTAGTDCWRGSRSMARREVALISEAWNTSTLERRR